MPVDVLILAAGGARRFGDCKLLSQWRGLTLLEHVLRKAMGLDVTSVNLILGGYAVELETFLQSKSELNVRRFYCPDWREGLGNSLAFGITQLPPENAVLVVLADQPLVELADLQNILAFAQRHPAKIVCAEFSGTRGVPALFPPEYKNLLRSLSGDRGAKAILAAADVLTLPVASAAVDIDFPADIQFLPS